jgi:prevent-host-death family protein
MRDEDADSIGWCSERHGLVARGVVGAWKGRTMVQAAGSTLSRNNAERYTEVSRIDRSIAMREIPASEVKTHLAQLLDEVERGETLIITRHGRRIARIVPDVDRRQEGVDTALAGIRELRGRTGRIKVDEVLSARDEGRKS